MTLQCRALLETLAGETLPDWERFARDVRVRRLSAGEALFHADQAWPWLAVVTSGVAKLVYPREDGVPFGAIGSKHNLIAIGFERHLGCQADSKFVVNDEDGCHDVELAGAVRDVKRRV